jgi:uncharacterized protein (DUF488 family)
LGVAALTDTPLITIGYEGRTPDEFVAVLRWNRVTKVVDVRQLPLSRKRGFSKTALSDTLSAQGIEYVGMRELGTPAPMRRQYKQTGDFDLLASQYRAHLADVDGSVEKLYQMAVADRICLLCFEREATLCHRSLLAAAVAGRNGTQFEVRHV